jgi:hypothetical protein
MFLIKRHGICVSSLIKMFFCGMYTFDQKVRMFVVVKLEPSLMFAGEARQQLHSTRI